MLKNIIYVNLEGHRPSKLINQQHVLHTARSLTDLNRKKKITFFLISVRSLTLTIMRQQMQRLSCGDTEDEDDDDDDDDDTASELN